MQKITLFAAMFWTASAFCQTPAREPDALQSLLVEVHQLRQAIEGITVASQRVQIALYAPQMQDAAVARSAQHLDGVRSRCFGVEEGRQHTAAEIQRLESLIASAMTPQKDAEAAKPRVTELKSQFDRESAEVQNCQRTEAEASMQLRNDQAKMLDLQDRIARLDKALEQLGSTVK